jgi:hypothetical protein
MELGSDYAHIRFAGKLNAYCTRDAAGCVKEDLKIDDEEKGNMLTCPVCVLAFGVGCSSGYVPVVLYD